MPIEVTDKHREWAAEFGPTERLRALARERAKVEALREALRRFVGNERSVDLLAQIDALLAETDDE